MEPNFLLDLSKDDIFNSRLEDDFDNYAFGFYDELVSQLQWSQVYQSDDITLNFHEYMPEQFTKNKAQCPICDAEFVSRKGMMQHKAKMHENLNKSVPCNLCGKFFKHKYALSFHVKQVHEKSTRVKCQLCSKVLYNKYAHKSHLNLRHNK